MDEANPDPIQESLENMHIELISDEIIDLLNVRVTFTCEGCGESADGWMVLTNPFIE
jgi:hypothetical protein